MNRRDDLLELTPQALTALANAGFVKRAQRETGRIFSVDFTERFEVRATTRAAVSPGL